MSMEPMDDFFKKKLEERDVPFNEAHWAAAQQLLEQQQARRRAIWWWWTGCTSIALAVVVFIILPAWWTPSPYLPNPSLKAFPIPEKQEMAASGRQPVKAPAPPSLNLDDPPTAVARREKAPANPAKTTTAAASEPTGQPASVPPSAAEPIASNLGSVAINAATVDSVVTIPAVQQTPLTPLPALAFSIETAADSPAALPATPVKSAGKWHASTLMGGSIHPTEGKAGPVLGIRVSYAIAHRYSLYAEALYRARPVAPSLAQRSLQQQFGFGLNERAYELQATGLHYADANLGAAYRFSRHTVYAGGGLSYLAGARGQLRRATKAESASGFAPQQTTEEGWIDTEALPGFRLRAQAGYEYRLLPRLGLHLRAQYRVGADASPLALDAPLSIDVMLNYSLW
jgi:hypothetical protein